MEKGVEMGRRKWGDKPDGKVSSAQVNTVIGGEPEQDACAKRIKFWYNVVARCQLSMCHSRHTNGTHTAGVVTQYLAQYSMCHHPYIYVYMYMVG